VGESPADTSVTVDVDSTSLRVREGVGGMQPLADDDMTGIEQTIDDEVLLGKPITFRSNAVEPAEGGKLRVEGELTLVGETRPFAFEVEADEDGRLAGRAVLKQSDWGMKPYSALFGALKVADDVSVAIDQVEAAAEPATGEQRPYAAVPIVDPGISSFLWALLFFGYLFLGMAAIGISAGFAFIVSAVTGFFIFLFVRTHGVGRQDT